jgi:multidrug efflux pump subunit AcrB
MKKLITFFVLNPIWGNAFLVLTMVFGILGLMNMRKSFFPEIPPRIITINVMYPGASPFEMETNITTKIEQALDGIPGIKKIISTSSENLTSVTIEGFEDIDMNELLTDVENTVNSITGFPTGAEKPIVKRNKVGQFGGTAAFISLTGPEDLWKLKLKAEEIENDLLASPDISQLRLVGFPEVEISIEVSEDKLLEYGLRFDQVVNAIRKNNTDLTGGTIKTVEEEYIIRLRSRSTDPEVIGNIVLRATPKGELILVNQVAEVKLKFSDQPFRSFIDGKRNVMLLVSKLPNEDLGGIASFINTYVQEFNTREKDYNLQITFQFSDMLQERIDLLTTNGMQGFILVLLCLGFFLSLRVSFWVAFGIPISFLGLFALGWLYGMTINMISLFGMILVVGMLVDDGIVIAENIFSHYERGKSPMRAAIDGMTEVFTSVVSSVLTTVVAFALLMYVGGQFEAMREMAFAVVACLLFSLVEAVLTLPQHMGKESTLKPLKIGWYNKMRGKLNGWIERRREGFGRIQDSILKRRRIMVFIPVMFITLIILALKLNLILFTFFPNIPFDSLTLEVAFKPGERDQQTEDYLRFCQQKVYEVRDSLYTAHNDTVIETVNLSIGNAEGLDEMGAHAGSLRITIDVEGKDISSQAIVDAIQKKIGPVKGPEKFSIGGEMRFGKPVAIMLSSNNYEELSQAKDFVKKELQMLGTVKNITDNNPVGRQEIQLELKAKAYLLGLDRAEIARQIRQGFFGDEAQRLIIGEDEARVYIRYPESNRTSIGDLENMYIKTSTNENFPLHDLAELKIERGITGIRHYNGKTEITVEADLNNANAPVGMVLDSISKKIIPKLKSSFPSVETQYLGQAERAKESQGPLMTVMVLSILFIILILALNFGSLMQAFVVMTVIPAGVFCALFGHGLELKPVSLFSFWGIIALIGILVNDAVVMVDTYNRNILAGMDVRSAALNAAKSRFRPIILTSVTTVVGLYPLIMEDSFQAQFLIPMAIAVAHGLFWGTIMTLFFLPSAILFWNDMRRAWVWLWKGHTSPFKATLIFTGMIFLHILLFFPVFPLIIASQTGIAYFMLLGLVFPIIAMISPVIYDKIFLSPFRGRDDLPNAEEVEPVLRLNKKALLLEKEEAHEFGKKNIDQSSADLL